jgi:hypothetical protein
MRQKKDALDKFKITVDGLDPSAQKTRDLFIHSFKRIIALYIETASSLSGRESLIHYQNCQGYIV